MEGRTDPIILAAAKDSVVVPLAARLVGINKLEHGLDGFERIGT
jgi:hypothetical protein